jgi:hypothetical protein
LLLMSSVNEAMASLRVDVNELATI